MYGFRLYVILLIEGESFIVVDGFEVIGGEVLGVVEALAPDGRLMHALEAICNNFINDNVLRGGKEWGAKGSVWVLIQV